MTIPLGHLAPSPQVEPSRDQVPMPDPSVARIVSVSGSQLGGGTLGDILAYDQNGNEVASLRTDLGLTSLRVLTNHPRKLVALEGYGLTIADQEPILIAEKKISHQKF